MAIAVSEEKILQALRQVPAERWPDILRYLSSLQSGTAVAVDATAVGRLADRTWTAAALQQLPQSIQDAVLGQQAARLVAHYQRDPRFAEGLTWWTAGEIGRLPVHQRDILLEASATVAAQEYHTNPELTAFDAFGEDDLYGDSASSEPFPPAADAR